MNLLWLLLPLIEGPTQRGERAQDPRAQTAQTLDPDHAFGQGSDWETLLSDADEGLVQRGASMMRAPVISLRGSRAAQMSWRIEGLPMSDSAGGTMGLRSVDPRLFRRASLLTAGGSGVGAPIGGELRLRAGRYPRLSLDLETSTQRDLSMLLMQSMGRFELGYSVKNSPGRFLYFDPKGTHFTAADDGWSWRDNNAARRANISLRHRLGGKLSGLLITNLRGQVAGSAHHPLGRVDEEEGLVIAYHQRMQVLGRVKNLQRLAVSHRSHRLDDPTASLSGLAGLQPRSAEERIIFQAESHRPGLSLQLQGKVEGLRQRPNPQQSWAMGGATAMDAGISWRRRAPWTVGAWLTGGLSWRQTQHLMAALPMSLQRGNQNPIALRVNPGLSIGRGPFKARLIAGQRAPTVMELIGQHGGLRGNPDLKPERAISAEVGGHFFAKPRRLKTILYGRRSLDLIDWTATSFGRATAVNRAMADVLGFAMVWRHQRGPWRSALTYRWQGEWAYDSALDRHPSRLIGSPEHRLRAQLFWKNKKVELSMAQDIRSEMQLDPSGHRILGPSAQSHLRGRWTLWHPAIQLTAVCHNLFNQMVLPLSLRGYEPTVPVPVQDRWGLPLPGRTLTVGLRVKQP